MARALTLTLAMLIFAPSTAHAGWRTDRARAIAETAWHHPCADQVTIQWAEIPAATVAQASDCTVTLSAIRHPQWSRLCTTMLHEYGHLAGYRDPRNTADPMHSIDPGSVMYFEESPDSHDYRCERRGRPYLERHGLLRPHHRLRVKLHPANPRLRRRV